jgi:hypothetical protein
LRSFWYLRIDGRRELSAFHQSLARLRIGSIPNQESVILSLDETNRNQWVRSKRIPPLPR